MLIGIEKRKCLSCGHVFGHGLGGIILITAPKCPECGSKNTLKIGRFL